MIYDLPKPFVINEEANPRFQNASSTDVRISEKHDYYHGYYRIIGGDMGDLLFNGYSLEDGKTILSDPAISTHLKGKLTPDEVMDMAQGIFDASYASIGLESIE